MKISTSLLSIWDNIEKIKEIDQSMTDYIHLDVMNNTFVKNKASYTNIDFFQKKIDIHFMVTNIKEEIDKYLYLHPTYITFHLEATDKVEDIINYVRSKKIKVGISINPITPVSKIAPYLPLIDLVLVMSVTPGYGGQTFIENTVDKIEQLKGYQKKYSFLIEVDGGINSKTIEKCKDADIVVVGSFITHSNKMNKQIAILKNLIK